MFNRKNKVLTKDGLIWRLILMSVLIAEVTNAQVWTPYLGGKSIQAMVWDSKRRLLWFATGQDGVISFDGTSFTEYNTITTQGALVTDSLTSAVIDKDGKGDLWFGTQSRGLIRFKPDSNKWQSYIIRNRELERCGITSLATDAAGAIWIGTRNCGAYRFDRHARLDTFTVATTNNGLIFDNIISIAVDDSDDVWFGTDGRGVSRRKANGKWIYYPELDGRAVGGLYVDKVDGKRSIWMGTDDGVYLLFPDEGIFDPRPRARDSPFGEKTKVELRNVRSIISDEDGYKWFGFDQGAWRLDLAEPESLRWKPFTDVTTLADRKIKAMTLDEDGNLWFGDLLFEGAIKMGSNWLTSTRDDGLGIFFNRVNALAEDRDGVIWAGTLEGVAKLKSTRWRTFTLPTISRRVIRAIAIDSANHLWLGTETGGVVRVPPGVNPDALPPLTTYYTVDNTNGGLANNNIFDIALFRDEVWFATQGGVSKFLPASNQWEKFTTSNSDLINDDLRAIAVDTSGIVWCGTTVGVSRFDRQNWQNFTTTTDDSLSSNFINDILIDEKTGKVLFATRGRGVSIYQNGRWRRPIKIEDGLADNLVYVLLKADEPAGMWFGTGNGASFLDFTTGIWTTVTKQHGLGENDVRALLQDRNKNIWFGTALQGVTRYKRKKNAPRVELLTQFDIVTNPQIMYKFIGSDLGTTAEQLRYAYKIDNKPYLPWSFNTFAILAIDRKGMHTFYVKAIDTDGNESPVHDATDTFYFVDPDTGSFTVFADTTKWPQLDSGQVKLTLYWPPYQFGGNVKISVSAVDPDSLDSFAQFAYDLTSADTGLVMLDKPVTLTFSFPHVEAIRKKSLGIYREPDNKNKKALKLVGASSFSTSNDTLNISTAIRKLGRYSVRDSTGDRIFSARFDTLKFNVSAQPRIFSPRGGGHGEKTTLSFHLPQPAHVKISVYNLAGRLVDIIWNQPMSAGVNAVAWDGREKGHRICPSGLYLMVIESNGFQSPPKPVKVMVLNE